MVVVSLHSNRTVPKTVSFALAFLKMEIGEKYNKVWYRIYMRKVIRVMKELNT